VVTLLPPRASYFVCFSPRSGSTLLCEALGETDIAGRPREYLPDEFPPREIGITRHDAAWRQDWYTQPLSDSVNRMFEYGTTPNGIFGAKVLTSNLRYLERALGADPGLQPLAFPQQLMKTFPNLRYIWTTRRDKVRQAVSYFKACQSNTFIVRSGEEPEARPLAFNFQLIDTYLRAIIRDEEAWAEYFISAGIVPCTVIYEDLIIDYEGTVRRVLEYLGISLPDSYRFPSPSLKRQADALSDEWTERYQAIVTRRHGRERIINLARLLRSQSLRDAFVTPRLRDERARLRQAAVHLLRRP